MKKILFTFLILVLSLNCFSDETEARKLFLKKEYDKAITEYLNSIDFLSNSRSKYENIDYIYNKYTIKLIFSYEGLADCFVIKKNYEKAFQIYKTAYSEFIRLYKRYYEDKMTIRSKLNKEESFIRIQNKLLRLENLVEETREKEKESGNESKTKLNENTISSKKSDTTNGTNRIPEILPPDYLFSRRVDENGNVTYVEEDKNNNNDKKNETQKQIPGNGDRNEADEVDKETSKKTENSDILIVDVRTNKTKNEKTEDREISSVQKKNKSDILAKSKEDTYEIKEENILYSIEIDSKIEEKIEEEKENTEEIQFPKENDEADEKTNGKEIREGDFTSTENDQQKREEKSAKSQQESEEAVEVSIDDKKDTFEQEDSVELYALEFLDGQKKTETKKASELSEPQIEESDEVQEALKKDEKKDKKIIISSGEGITVGKDNSISVEKGDNIVINSDEGFVISSNGKEKSIDSTSLAQNFGDNEKVIDLLKSMEKQQDKKISQMLADLYKKINELETKQKTIKSGSDGETDNAIYLKVIEDQFNEMKNLFEQREKELQEEIAQKIKELEGKIASEKSTDTNKPKKYAFAYIYLNDGSRISGYIIDMTNSYYIIESSYPVAPIAKSKVKQIEFRLAVDDEITLTISDGTKIKGKINDIIGNYISLETVSSGTKVINKNQITMVEYN